MPSLRAKLGSWGESLACRMLRAKGYAILSTNYRCRWGEVDIIAQRNTDLVFVEVRTRSSPALGTPEESLTAAKARRLIATAETYLQSLETPPAAWRIDLVSVRVSNGRRLESVQHLENVVEV